MMNNLLKRSLSGVIFGAVMICSLVVWKPLFPVAVIVAIYFMMSEFYEMSMGDSFRVQQKLSILSAETLFLMVYSAFEYGLGVKWLLLSQLPVLAVMITVLFNYQREQLHLVTYLFTGLVYIGIPTSLVPILAFRGGEFNGLLLLCFFIIIWCSDIGAYCLGTLFGQKPGSRKLAPKISPKKSWWGVWSGLAFAMGSAFLVREFGWLELSVGHSLALGIVVSAAGVCGDLFESVWKRYFYIKDSGNVIPGHGGMLDRFDSSLFAIPAGTVYLAIFNLL